MALKEVCDAYLNRDDAFLAQIGGACLMAARDIRNEDVGTANHAERMVWVEEVEADPLGMARNFVRDVTLNATIAANLPDAVDSDVQYVVNGLIDPYVVGE